MGDRCNFPVAEGSTAGCFELGLVERSEGMMLHKVSDLLLDSGVVHEKAMEAGDLQEVGHPFEFGFLD
jgi:hypothetical protein